MNTCEHMHFDDFINDLNEHITNESTKLNIMNWINEKILHSEIYCTFEEVFKIVWMRVEKLGNNLIFLEKINEEFSVDLNDDLTQKIVRLVDLYENVVNSVVNSVVVSNV